MKNLSLPNFIIAGAPKAGTTSLYATLAQHPEVYFPYIKEPCYFSNGWHYTVDTWDKYVQLFSSCKDEKAIGEASTQYMADADAPGRIVERLGKIKILFILRNPVDRAYSQWGQARYDAGIETYSFEEALKMENTRHTDALKKERYYHPQVFKYFERGLYARYIQRYLDIFGPEHVKTIIFEEFVKDIPTTSREIYNFIGVDPNFVPTSERRNIAHQPYFRMLNYFFVHPPEWIANIYKKSPSILRRGVYTVSRIIHQANQSKPRRSTGMTPQLRSILLEQYIPSIHDLEQILGRSLSVWY